MMKQMLKGVLAGWLLGKLSVQMDEIGWLIGLISTQLTKQPANQHASVISPRAPNINN